MLLRVPMALAMAITVALLAGCGGEGAPSSGRGAGHGVPATQAADSQKSGAQLWAENCSRCHNIRPPQSFNSAQWQAVVMHMRLRADLTGVEQRKITAFLQANH